MEIYQADMDSRLIHDRLLAIESVLVGLRSVVTCYKLDSGENTAEADLKSVCEGMADVTRLFKSASMDE